MTVICPNWIAVHFNILISIVLNPPVSDGNHHIMFTGHPASHRSTIWCNSAQLSKGCPMSSIAVDIASKISSLPFIVCFRPLGSNTSSVMEKLLSAPSKVYQLHCVLGIWPLITHNKEKKRH